MPRIDLRTPMPYGSKLIHTGIYRIPQDMSADLADRALRAGLGVMLPEEKAKTKLPEPKSAGAAPENKMLEVPADKATFSSTGSVKGLVKGHRGGQRAVADD